MRSKLPVRKSKEELQFYIEHGKIFGDILHQLFDSLSKGNFTNGIELELEYIQLVEKIKNKVWRTAKYPFIQQTNYLEECFGYGVCVSVNDTVAHCRPNANQFKEGDVISVDFGLSLMFKGRELFFDSAFTTIYKKPFASWVLAPHEALVEIEKEQALTTHRIAEIIYNKTIEKNLETIVMLTGHGIGYSLHEEPIIRNAPGDYSNVSLFDGLCFCAEPIFVLPKEQRYSSILARAYVDSDGWSVRTVNNQPSSHFETMFCISNNNLVDLCGITKWFC